MSIKRSHNNLINPSNTDSNTYSKRIKEQININKSYINKSYINKSYINNLYNRIKANIENNNNNNNNVPLINNNNSRKQYIYKFVNHIFLIIKLRYEKEKPFFNETDIYKPIFLEQFKKYMISIIRILFYRNIDFNNIEIINSISNYVYNHMINDTLVVLKTYYSQKQKQFNRMYLYNPTHNIKNNNRININTNYFLNNIMSKINKELRKYKFINMNNNEKNKYIDQYLSLIEEEKLIKDKNLDKEKIEKIIDLIIYSIKLKIPAEKILLKSKINKIIRGNFTTMENIN